MVLLQNVSKPMEKNFPLFIDIGDRFKSDGLGGGSLMAHRRVYVQSWTIVLLRTTRVFCPQ